MKFKSKFPFPQMLDGRRVTTEIQVESFEPLSGAKNLTFSTARELIWFIRFCRATIFGHCVKLCSITNRSIIRNPFVTRRLT